MLSEVQTGNRLSKFCHGIKIRIRDAPIPRPKTCINGELGQIGKAPNLLCPISLAAGENAEMGEVSGAHAFRFQVILKKPGVADLVVGIVVDVLRHVPIEQLERLSISCVAACQSRELVILGTTEFGVLPPKVFFHLLKGLQKPEDRDVSLGDWWAVVVLLAECKVFTGQQSGTHSCRARYCSILQE